MTNPAKQGSLAAQLDTEMMITCNITGKSLNLFLLYAKDACNWSGTPLVGGNVENTKEDRSNLTQLKKMGLITTDISDDCVWLYFTDKGKEWATKYGIEI